MTSPSLRDLLRAYDLDPKKSLGQNFLADDAYLDRIVDGAKLTADDTVLEIGPGLGSLTARLVNRAGRVVAVELDDRLISVLRGMFGTRENVEIVHGDILELGPGTLVRPDGGDSLAMYKVVANLPYYITSAVIRHLLEAAFPPSLTVVMVQQEVAERICAQPGNMSILSVAVQYYAEPSILFNVPASAFYPQPKVDSAVLRLETRLHPATAGIDPAIDTRHFFRIVRAGFSQKRKQLRNSLSAGLHLSKAQIDGMLFSADIDPSRRAQTLSITEWVQLYQVVREV